MKNIVLFLFVSAILIPKISEAQNSFTKEDFGSLCISSFFAMKYQMDSTIYEHGFRASNSGGVSDPYLFYYEHGYIEGVSLVVFYNKDVELLNVLVHTSDYDYYRGLRNNLTVGGDIDSSELDLYGYTCKIIPADPFGNYVDGIGKEKNAYLVGWIMKINDWDKVYDNAN